MRSLWLPLVLTGFAIAQTPGASLTLTGPAVAPAGSAVTLTVSLVSGSGPAGLQWDQTGIPTGATITSPVAGKTANCTAALNRCILTGANATAIPDGPIATIKYTQPAASVTVGIPATSTLGATPAGAAEAVTAPALALTVPVQSNCDINGDGKTDATDVGLILQQALTSTTGTPNVLDVIRVIIAANGGVCLR